MTCDRQFLAEDWALSTRSRVFYNPVVGSDMWTARCKFGYPEQEDVGMYYLAYRADVTLSKSPWTVRQTDNCLSVVLASTEVEMVP